MKTILLSVVYAGSGLLASGIVFAAEPKGSRGPQIKATTGAETASPKQAGTTEGAGNLDARVSALEQALKKNDLKGDGAFQFGEIEGWPQDSTTNTAEYLKFHKSPRVFTKAPGTPGFDSQNPLIYIVPQDGSAPFVVGHIKIPKGAQDVGIPDAVAATGGHLIGSRTADAVGVKIEKSSLIADGALFPVSDSEREEFQQKIKSLNDALDAARQTILLQQKKITDLESSVRNLESKLPK